MAIIKKDGGYNALPIAYKRGNPIALDTTSVWYSYSDLETYAASGATAYVGQIVAYVDEVNSKAEAYVISDAEGTLVKLAQTTASGDLASDVSALQAAIGHPAEDAVGEVGQPGYKAAVAATGIYKLIDDEISDVNSDISSLETIVNKLNGASSVSGSVAEAKAAADAAQSDVDALELVVGTKGTHSDVYTEIDALATEDTALDGRLDALEALHAKDGDNFKTVAQEAAAAVAEVVNGANESFDTLKEIADWIANDSSGAASMANDISALKTTVGGDTSGLVKKVADLESKTAGDFTVGEGSTATTDIKNYIDAKAQAISSGLGDLAGADEVSEEDLDTELAAKINGKADKVASATSGNFAGLDENGNLTDSGKKAADFATAAQGSKADSAIQTIKINNTALTASSNAINITAASGTNNGTIAINGSDISVTGLGSAAYTATTAYDAAGSADAVLGTATDTDTSVTVYGVKAAVTTLKATVDADNTLLTTINSADTVDGSFRKAAKDAANAVLGTVSDASTADTVYGAKAAVTAAKSQLVGSDADSKTSNTIYGAKAYADDAVATAKSNLIGTATDSTTANTIYGSKAYADAAITSEVSRADGKYVAIEENKRLMTSAEGTKLGGISEGANKVEATAKSGKIKIDGTEIQVVPDNVVTDSNYNHITVTSTSVSDGTNTFNKYTHPTVTAATAAAKKVGYDTLGHVVLGDVLTASDVGAEAAFTDGSATIASVSDGVVTIKAGVAQSAGAIAQGTGTDITLAKVATTGAAADVSIADSGSLITATTVEGALAELAASITSASTGAAVTCAKTTPDGVAARYTFSQGGTAIANAVIDIPKDMVVSAGSVVTKSESGTWGNAGTYIELTLANATNDKLYIDVGNLIEYVTSGSGTDDMVKVTVSSEHKVTAAITDGTVTLAKLASAVQTEINKAHEHSNKALLDSYTQTEANLADAVSKKHSHTNSSVLDGITAAKVEAWDGAASAIDDAVEASVATLDYTDTAVAGEYVSKVDQANGVISVTRVALPTATAAALGMVQVDNSTIQVSNAGVISVKAVSTDLLTQGTEELVLNGGTA